MAYDENLTLRFREALHAAVPEAAASLSEKKMMGGVCFLLNGNMVGGADRTKAGVGRFMFRVGKDNDDEGLTRPGAVTMHQGGRRMTGFFFVEESDCNAETMKSWIDLALSFVKTLPPKK